MIDVERTISVNGSDVPAAARLTAEDVWAGLVMKAENAIPFVDAISRCQIIERTGNQLVREIDLRGETLREEVTFEPPHRVVFERLSGKGRGTIVNEILVDAAGNLNLRFAFELVVDGIPEGSDEESSFATSFGDAYLSAANSTLAEVRRLKTGGQLRDGAGI